MANTTVSYAQAAKGHNAPPAGQPHPQPVSSPALSSQTKEDAPTTNPTSTAASSVATNDVESRDAVKLSQPDVDSAALKQDASEVASLTDTASSTISASEGSAKQHGDGEGNGAGFHGLEDKTRSSSRTSRSNDGMDGKKGRKPKKGRGADKESDLEKSQELEKEVPKPVLTEAKPPPVNIWVQRAEAQQAKTKVTPVTTPTPAQSAFPPATQRRTPTDVSEAPGALVNGTHGDKLQRKPGDASRVTEQVTRRAGPRGGRANDKEEKVNGYVPPVADTSLWPDPKSANALEEEKKKTAEKVERSEKDSQAEAEPVKTQKQKWEKVDFVPTVAFNTPIPPRNKPRVGRGGREAAPGRGGHGASGVGSGSAADKGSAPGPTKPGESPQHDSVASARGASLPPSASKRMSVDASHPRDQRKSSTAGKEPNADSQAVGDTKPDGSRPARGEYGQVNPEAPSFPSRNERRGDFPKDQAGQGPSHQSFPSREGRADRGRGGFRRGGHSGPVGPQAPQGAFTPQNGQYSGHMPFPGRQNGPYSPPSFQTAFPNSFGPAPGRGGRGNGRGNASGPVPGRSSSNGHGFPPKMPQFNPGNHYDYGMQQFAPYNYPVPTYEPSILQIAQAQIEYYVSINNLCKDRFLRSHMNDDGWVDLNVIANFKRMLDLTKGDREVVRTACLMSDHVEVVVGDDGIERLRARNHWQSFTLPDSDRVPEARGGITQNLYPVPRPPVGGPYHGHMIPAGYTSTSPTRFAPGYPMEEQMFQQGYINGGHFEQPVNGVDASGHPYPEASQLSAAVPEFSPNGGNAPLTLDSMTNFPDAKVENLMMLVASSKGGSSSHPGPNGSVVNGDVPETDEQATATEARTEEGHSEVQSPLAGSRFAIVSWTNSDKAASGDDNSEPYLAFRTKALEERKAAKPGETTWLMRQLYEFWAGFLVANFNAKMYDEFRSLAIEDANQAVPSRTGLKNLLRYYNSLFYGEQLKPWGPDRPVPEIFTLHYQEADGLNHGVNGDLRA
ncbi:hypothetical protein GQ53DRAFT_830230 [Thozetella sp. PMI_491]|nr:hypothetical protein GQ53DRAFT_830230 [Thozetella sp. PMI_491]